MATKEHQSEEKHNIVIKSHLDTPENQDEPTEEKGSDLRVVIEPGEAENIGWTERFSSTMD